VARTPVLHFTYGEEVRQGETLRDSSTGAWWGHISFVAYKSACGKVVDPERVTDTIEDITCRRCATAVQRDAPELLAHCLHPLHVQWVSLDRPYQAHKPRCDR